MRYLCIQETMSRSIQAAAVAAALALPGCNDQVSLQASEAHSQTTQSVQATRPDDFGVGFSGPARGGFAKVTLQRGSTVVRTLADAGAVYVKDVPPNLSPRGNLLQITQLDSGPAVVGTGDMEYHDRAYCLFVSTQSACVLVKESGEFCGGEWQLDETWTTPSGTPIDLRSRAAARITDLSAESAFDDHDAAYSRENFRLCRTEELGDKP